MGSGHGSQGPSGLAARLTGLSKKSSNLVNDSSGLAVVLHMEATMTDANHDTDELLERLRRGDEHALTRMFLKHPGRLRRMVRFRMDRRLQGRVDPSDVLREAYLDVARRAGEYLAHQDI